MHCTCPNRSLTCFCKLGAEKLWVDLQSWSFFSWNIFSARCISGKERGGQLTFGSPYAQVNSVQGLVRQVFWDRGCTYVVPFLLSVITASWNILGRAGRPSRRRLGLVDPRRKAGIWSEGRPAPFHSWQVCPAVIASRVEPVFNYFFLLCMAPPDFSNGRFWMVLATFWGITKSGTV